MSAPEPPKPRGRIASSDNGARHSRLSVTEINLAPEATRESRPPAPPYDERNTLAPPRDPRQPPKEYARPRPVALAPLAAPRLPTAVNTEEPTLHGLGVPDRDSMEIPVETLLAEITAKDRRARQAEAELAAAKAELEAAKRIPVIPAPTPPVGEDIRSKWHATGLKFIGALTVLVAAAATWLEVHTANVSTHVDNVAAKQVAEKVVVDPLPARIDRLEAYVRLKIERDKCVEGQLRGALKRATGYSVTSISETTVHWASESAKSWFPTGESECISEPQLP